MFKVCEVSRGYTMLFVHSCRYLPLSGLLTDLRHVPYLVKTTRNFFMFLEIFQAKKFHEI